jgi:nitrite reductase/ring-hydroxylating ferredoxin subunit
MLAGLASIGASGWLGGHLGYAMGVGVDTNAFSSGPDEWAPAQPASDEASDGMCSWSVGGVRVVTIDDGGHIYAVADRCSHRGGPLSRGRRDDNCVTCPWHRSRFDFRDGSVVDGPATVAQPTYEVRQDADRIAFRRIERRSLRRNPI